VDERPPTASYRPRMMRIPATRARMASMVQSPQKPSPTSASRPCIKSQMPRRSMPRFFVSLMVALPV